MLVSHGPRLSENVRLKNAGQINGGTSGRIIWFRLTVSQKKVSPDFRNRKDALLLSARYHRPQIDHSARRAPDPH
jgi:hypothetical protein